MRNYDDADQLLTVVDASNTVTATYTYSDNGLVLSTKDAKNNVTSNIFDGFDRIKKVIYPDSTYDEIQSYNSKDLPLVTRSRSAATIVFTYDELDRLKTKTPSGQATATINYNLEGQVISIGTPVVAGDPSTGMFQYFYDSATRKYKETYPDGKSITHELDANGNITKTTYPDGIFYTSRTYDQLNRLTDIKINGATTSAIQIQYDALSRRKKIINENGTFTEFSFNAESDLSSIAHSFVGSSTTFSYSFDIAGQMISTQVTDGSNFMWHPGATGTATYGNSNSLNQYTTVNGTAMPCVPIMSETKLGE